VRNLSEKEIWVPSKIEVRKRLDDGFFALVAEFHSGTHLPTRRRLLVPCTGRLAVYHAGDLRKGTRWNFKQNRVPKYNSGIMGTI
jgi:hypothetical protein